MGWGYGVVKTDRFGEREVGYTVEAPCDEPECMAQIDRGLDYRCGGQGLSESYGCGGFFCHEHLYATARRPQRCAQCCRYSCRQVVEIQQQRERWKAAS